MLLAQFSAVMPITPLASVHLQPAIIRSVVDGGRQGRIPMGPNLPRVVKQTLFWLLDKGWADRLLAPPINSFRLTVGLPPVRRISGDYVHSPEMVIGLFPEWFASIQLDWPHNLHLAGFVLHDESERQPVSAEVQRFLADGPPPVIFTPGSAAATLRDFFRESVEACRIGGYRAMLVTRYPEQLPADLPVGMRHFSYLPFGQILPRCATLVYPGGIGTMAQAIKAGIPHLVVPHGHDQPDNAYRVKRLGLGQSILPERYKAKRVARILSQLLASSETRSRCAVFSNRINSADALGISCDLIENLGQSRRQGNPAALSTSASPNLAVRR